MTKNAKVGSVSQLKLQLHDTIYRLQFYSNSLIHILSLSNSYNNVDSIQKNRGDKSHRVIIALGKSTVPCKKRLNLFVPMGLQNQKTFSNISQSIYSYKVAFIKISELKQFW